MSDSWMVFSTSERTFWLEKIFPSEHFLAGQNVCVCVFFPPGAFFWLVNVEKL